MSIARKSVGNATLADLLAIPEEIRRHELVDGEILEKEAASGRHGGAQSRLGRVLGPFDRGPGGPPGSPGGWWIASEVEIFFDPSNTLRPDCAGWRRERLPVLPADTPIRVVPDWICEILSTNRRNDIVKKKRVYHRHHVQHYWILDPSAEALLVYRHGPEGYIEILVAQRGERVRAEPFASIEFPVGVFFGDDD